MSKKGIDVSTHNGLVDWQNIECDFAIIRTGFGKNSMDAQFENNVNNCNVPYGFYHFSYAYNMERLETEADFVIDLLKKYNAKPTLPVFFDWEYDSDRYAREQDVIVDKTLFNQMAVRFMDKLKSAGYKAGIYYNYDYLRNYCDTSVLDNKKYYQWVAYYGDNISVDCDMWQNTDRGSVPGFTGDINILYNEILLGDLVEKDETKDEPDNSTVSRVLKTGENQITFKYGNGHGGIDIVKERNSLDEIIAHTKGRVTFCQTGFSNQKGASGNASYGNCIKILHPNGYSTLYAHLDKVAVVKGEKVATGQKIGTMGNTGNSYGAHLHFEVRDESDDRMNPYPYINASLPNMEDFEPNDSAITPSNYTTGNYIVTASVLNVREKPTTKSNRKSFSQLTKNAQKQIFDLAGYKVNGYVKGIVCTVTQVSGTWGKTPSGWIYLKYCDKK